MENIWEFYNISFLLEEMARVSDEEDRRYHQRKARLQHLPTDKRKAVKRDMRYSRDKKLAALTDALKACVNQLNLPPELASRILRLATRVQKEGHSFDMSAAIKAVEQEAQEIAEKIAAEREKGQGVAERVAQAVQSHVASEKFEIAVQSYFDKILSSEVTHGTSQPAQPKPTYPKKRGSVLPQAEIELQQQYQDKLLELYVQERQAAQKKNKQPVSSAKELLNEFAGWCLAKQTKVLHAVEVRHEKELAVYKNKTARVIDAAIEKSKQRYYRKAAKKAKGRRKRSARRAGKRSVGQIIKDASRKLLHVPCSKEALEQATRQPAKGQKKRVGRGQAHKAPASHNQGYGY